MSFVPDGNGCLLGCRDSGKVEGGQQTSRPVTRPSSTPITDADDGLVTEMFTLPFFCILLVCVLAHHVNQVLGSFLHQITSILFLSAALLPFVLVIKRKNLNLPTLLRVNYVF